MLPPTTVSWFLTACLSSFFIVNAHNIAHEGRKRRGTRPYAEVERPRGLTFAMAAVGTVAFFVEAFAVMILGFIGSPARLISLPIPETAYGALEIVGLSFIGMGIAVFNWSVLARGRYAVSWQMPEDHVLVTSGPYRYVRHPSYLGYFLMAIGLLMVRLSLPSLIPLLVIPGYMGAAPVEEELLTRRFGEEYRRYMEKTGRYIPRFPGA